MRMPRWTQLFHKCCPWCEAVVQDGAEGAVRRLGHLYCCEVHADSDEASLERALQELYRGHAARHGGNRLLPATVLTEEQTDPASPPVGWPPPLGPSPCRGRRPQLACFTDPAAK